MEDGKQGTKIQLARELFCADGELHLLPLKYESEGIKKITSILHLLVAAYNNPSITLAIDELDSGIYEYLLGELLRIMQNSGNGQLIFTSHNLYPLETLESNSIVFTTTNSNARYCNIFSTKNIIDFKSQFFRIFHDFSLLLFLSILLDTANDRRCEYELNHPCLLNSLGSDLPSLPKRHTAPAHRRS